MITVAFCFDDGPSRWTLPILDTLAEHGARATFFVLGQRVAPHEQTVRRAVAEGHEVAVHGWDHTPMDYLGPQHIRDGLARTVTALTAVGVEPVWWHPPWNRTTPEAAEAATELGLSFCRDTVEGCDVSRPAGWIVANVLRQASDGAIVGLHDGIAVNGERHQLTRQPTVDALGRLLKELRSVTVSELLRVTA